jgi:hypothetical protein
MKRHGGKFRCRGPNQYLVCDVVTRALGEAAKRPEVTSFFDEPTNTASHVVRDPASRCCGVIDSVLDYDAASGRTAARSADVRTARDTHLGMPKLILPSVQVNMRAGEFPPAEDDGQTYLKIPVNQL